MHNRFTCYLAVVLFALITSHSHAITVTDTLGRTVTLAQPAQRIVALAPHVVENVFSAGAGDRLVGVVSYSNYPPEASKLPNVGGYHAFSREAIVALKPDLVLLWSEGNDHSVAEPFTDLGLTVYVDEPRKLEAVANSIRNIGVLAGTSNVADAVANDYIERLTKLRQQYSTAQPLTVFYQVWDQPLQTLNSKHIISDVISLCGGRNVFADEPIVAPKISLESVIDRDPDVIIASGMGEERPEWLGEWRKFPQLTAVINNNLYFIPPDILQRHSARILSGAEQMCRHLEQARKKLKQKNNE